MATQTTNTSQDAAETGEGTPKGFEKMARKMQECSCCGMMEKVLDVMRAKCGTANDGQQEDETAGNASPGSQATD